MKDWCCTNSILQVHCWRCLVVPVMFHELITSLMTSQDQKVSEILKLIYLRQYLSYRVDLKLKMSEMIMAILLVYSTSGITSGKKFVASSKWRPFWKFWNIKHSFNLTSDMKRSSQIMLKKYFHDDDVIDDVTGWPQIRSSIFLYKWNNNIFHDNKKTSKDIIIKLSVHIGIMRLWLQLHKYIFMTSLMTSPGHKIGQSLKLIYLRQYLS